jgi:hypothetical protein
LPARSAAFDRARLLCLLVPFALAAALPGAARAQAQPSAAQRLVAKYSPILMLREQQDPPCDTTEEQFQPSSVDVVLGNPRVRLVKARKRGFRFVTNGPTAAEIAGLGSDYYMDLPSDPITSECTYARDFIALKRAGRAPPVTYARIARQNGHSGFVVQYWFFYYFNEFNDVHEGDWEGMQLVFDAETPEAALAEGPSKIALFQHGGGETADWDDSEVDKQGTHPIGYVAAGSHATFFGAAVYLQTGQGGAGLGCDNTTDPVRELAVRPVLVPTDPYQSGPAQWLTYEGHWGQKEKSFNNGPTGPNTKQVWKEPYTWLDRARLASPTLPGGSLFGTTATTAFCGAVAAVSEFVNAEARSPTGVIVLIAIIAALVLLPVLLTRWWPVDISRLRTTRAFGQLVRAARQLYGRHWRMFVPIALSAIPIIAVVEGLQGLYTALAGRSSFGPTLTIGQETIELTFTISGVLRPLGFALVGAAAVAGVWLLDRMEPPSVLATWKRTLPRAGRVIAAQFLATLITSALTLTVIGIPFAIWKFFEWQLLQQQIIFEDKSIREAFRGSSRLVRHHWWRTFRVAGFLALLTFVVGPILGFVLIFLDLELVWVNVISSLVYMLLVPFEAIGRTLLYFDLQERKEAEAKAAPAPRFRLRPRRATS